MVATFLILRALSDSFPREFGVVIQATVRIADNVTINEKYRLGFEKAVSFVETTAKLRDFPIMCTRLELGWNWGAAINKIISEIA